MSRPPLKIIAIRCLSAVALFLLAAPWHLACVSRERQPMQSPPPGQTPKQAAQTRQRNADAKKINQETDAQNP